MKIDYFNYLYDLKGISIGSYIKGLELMNALEARGHFVKKYWRLKHEPSPAQEGNEQPVRTIIKKHLHRYLHETNQIVKNVRFYREECSIIKKDIPDILIARMESYLFSPRLIGKKANIPIIAEADSPVVYELDNFGPRYRRIRGLAEKLEIDFINSADISFCVSNTLKQYFVGRGVPENHLHVITNGADLKRFNPFISPAAVQRRFPLQGKTVVGFVGSFHYWHGVSELIELIKAVVADNRDVVFLLVGSGGPMLDDLKTFIRTERLENRIFLTGYVEHTLVPAYISSMDIVIAPYPALDFFYYSPVKIFEYMACGKAVITSRIGQIAEVIENGRDGILCTPGSIREMIMAVKELAADKNSIERMGMAAFKKIGKQYSWHRKAQELEQLCYAAIDKG
ncbi:glycosyltransferase family 4 protein [bacterium]|nr:glycosyltransferase family 4 protein [bacterium]